LNLRELELEKYLRYGHEKRYVPEGDVLKAHDQQGKIVSWDKLLKGKSARIISTMDAPPWYYKWIIGDPGGKIMRKGILGFSGVSPVKTTYFGSVKVSTEKQRADWLKVVRNLGQKVS
jgi:putative NADPH-quinone reductase